MFRDGVKASGTITTWSRDGIDGSLGPRAWTDLDPRDIERIGRRLIDRDDPSHWLILGRALLFSPGAEDRATVAFDRARRLDPDVNEEIKAIRAARDARDAERAAHERAIEAEALRTDTPEANDWSDAPWPAMTPEQHRAARLTTRAAADEALASLGRSWSPIEFGDFLVYTDGDRASLVPLTRTLSRARETILHMLGTTPTSSAFWGHCVVMIIEDRATFELVEAELFRQLLPGNRHAICHFIGPQTYIIAHHDGDRQMLAWRLVRELTRACMHRHRTPRRPPAWLNEGLALHIAGSLVTPPVHKVNHRQVARDFITAGGDVRELFTLDYDHEAWPGPKGVAPAVGALVCERLIAERPNEFARWIIAMKHGETWETALVSTLGTTPAKLAAYVTAWYRVNE